MPAASGRLLSSLNLNRSDASSALRAGRPVGVRVRACLPERLHEGKVLGCFCAHVKACPLRCVWGMLCHPRTAFRVGLVALWLRCVAYCYVYGVHLAKHEDAGRTTHRTGRVIEILRASALCAAAALGKCLRV